MRDVLIARDVRMPTLAFGTYRLRGDECRDAVREALAVGFRHVDTATCYRNERAVAEALAATSLATSSETFITSKISPSEMHGEAETTRAIEGVVERLATAVALVGALARTEQSRAVERRPSRGARVHVACVRTRATKRSVSRDRGVELRDFASRGIARRRGDSCGGESSNCTLDFRRSTSADSAPSDACASSGTPRSVSVRC